MSAAAKEVLIKAVAQSLPTYIMSVFKLHYPTVLVGSGEWETEDGLDCVEGHNRKEMLWGIGFKDLRLFNQAMLARQAWRLIHFPESLCASLLKAKYYPNGNLVDTAFCTNPSQTWQGVMDGLDLLKQGVIWRIGNGTQVRIWRDPWIPRDYSHRVITRHGRCRLRWVL
jgi:hypothetical protein